MSALKRVLGYLGQTIFLFLKLFLLFNSFIYYLYNFTFAFYAYPYNVHILWAGVFYSVV